MESGSCMVRAVVSFELSLDRHATVDVKAEPGFQSQPMSNSIHRNSTSNARFILFSSKNTPIKVSHQHSDTKHWIENRVLYDTARISCLYILL